jgi:transposase
MQYNFIRDLIGIKDAIIKAIINSSDFLEITLELERKPHKCPCCGSITDTIHDYRIQTVKDLPIAGKHCILRYRKRRYRCINCHKRFFESNSFLGKYKRFTMRTLSAVVDALSTCHSMKSIRQQYGISINSISRVLDSLSYELTQLPEVLSIDEFKGNTDCGKYQCSIVDPSSRKVLDIIESRKYETLYQYFKKFNDRDNVKWVVIDMWRPYKDLVKALFKKATIIIDRFHYIRNCIWAIDKIRKAEQKKVSPGEYKFFKNSRKLLLANPDKLSDDLKVQLAFVLKRNERIRKAYHLKTLFMDFVSSENIDDASKKLDEWLDLAQLYDLPEFNYFSRTLVNWRDEILNSFKMPYNNGCIEGYNNKIKVIKRNAYGIRNFHRFRNRILHVTN